MNGLLHATGLIFATHLVRSFASKRAFVCLALAVMPAAIGAAIAHLSRRTEAVDVATWLGGLLVIQIVVPILGLVAGSAVVSEEVEDRTITYLFTRPIPRPALLLGRWLAALVLLSGVLALSCGLLLLAAGSARSGDDGPIGAGIARPLFEAALIGGAAYSALFAVAGIFFRHPILVGLGYAFAIEGFLANLPGRSQALTIQYHLRSWVLARGSEAWSAVEGFAVPKPESATEAAATLAIVVAAVLAIGAWRIARREFVLTS